MNLAEIRDLVKAEAALNGFKSNNVLIDSMINQELSAITGKSKYVELLTEFNYPPLTDEQYAFELPEDFQIFESLTYFRNSNTDPERITTLSLGLRTRGYLNYSGSPQFYNRIGNTFKVYPYTEVYDDDSLTLAYYKKVTLIEDTDLFPVESLEKSVIQMVMSRLLRARDSKQSMMAKQEGIQAWKESRSQDAGN